MTFVGVAFSAAAAGESCVRGGENGSRPTSEMDVKRSRAVRLSDGGCTCARNVAGLAIPRYTVSGSARKMAASSRRSGTRPSQGRATSSSRMQEERAARKFRYAPCVGVHDGVGSVADGTVRMFSDRARQEGYERAEVDSGRAKSVVELAPGE